MPQAAGLRISKKSAQKALTLLRKLALVNRELKLQRQNNCLHIPLIHAPTPKELEELKKSMPDLMISEREFFKSSKQPAGLVDILGDKLPPNVLG